MSLPNFRELFWFFHCLTFVLISKLQSHEFAVLIFFIYWKIIWMITLWLVFSKFSAEYLTGTEKNFLLLDKNVKMKTSLEKWLILWCKHNFRNQHVCTSQCNLEGKENCKSDTKLLTLLIRNIGQLHSTCLIFLKSVFL